LLFDMLFYNYLLMFEVYLTSLFYNHWNQLLF
jgi:hypothetical protein